MRRKTREKLERAIRQSASANATPWDFAETPVGIYFLLYGGAIVYVGKSTDLYPRLSAHQGKRADGVAFVTAPPELLDALERFYIALLRPPLNGPMFKNRPPQQYANLRLRVFIRAVLPESLPGFERQPAEPVNPLTGLVAILERSTELRAATFNKNLRLIRASAPGFFA